MLSVHTTPEVKRQCKLRLQKTGKRKYNENTFSLSHLAIDDFINRHKLEPVAICVTILDVSVSHSGALDM